VISIRLIFSISDIDAEADGMNESLTSEEESSESTAEVPADELGPVAVETQIVVSKGEGQGALTIDAVAEGKSSPLLLWIVVLIERDSRCSGFILDKQYRILSFE